MKYEYWLAALKDVSDAKKTRLRKEYPTAKEVYYIEETRLKEISFLTDKDVACIQKFRKTWQLEEKYEELCNKQIEMILFYDHNYPKKLLNISDPPYALYVKGKLPDTEKIAVGIVGARRCTPYGIKMAVQFAEELAACGIEVISGMAKGIDGAAGRGALNVQGGSYAVLGSGPDVCYPGEHRGLYHDLIKFGGILSEQPPGTMPHAFQFPARNRIISGLSDFVLVIEAKERSGSLITADLALEQGREVYALPGPVTSLLSEGCNRLIKQGAGVLLSTEELLQDMQTIFDVNVKKSLKIKKTLESTENLVYSCLGLYPQNTEQLISQTNLTVPELLNVLVCLEMKGYVEEISKNYYIKK